MGAGQSLGAFPAVGSYIVEKSTREGHGDVRGNVKYKDVGLVPSAFDDVKTLYDAFQ
jgi:hypothetical protein